MTDTRSADVGTQPATAVVSGKLPDDLVLKEFVDITRAVQALADSAVRGERLKGTPVVRVQYGSDYVVVLAIIAGAVSGFLGFARVLDALGSAGVKNEERLAKRDERLRRNLVIRSAEDQAIDAGSPSRTKELGKYEAIAEKESQMERMVSKDFRVRFAGEVGVQGMGDPRVVAAIAVLAEYGVKIEVREQ